MLEFLQGWATSRKLTLFAFVCCRRVWAFLNEKCQEIVEVGERNADGLTEETTLAEARSISKGLSRSALRAYGCLTRRQDNSMAPGAWAACAVKSAIHEQVSDAADAAVLAVVAASWGYQSTGPYVPERKTSMDRARSLELETQANLLREIFGNPWEAPTFDNSWLMWNDGTVPKIAQSIYDDRDFSLMPILADALEDAGCDNADILEHCRQPGEHARGCWVVDHLLGWPKRKQSR